MSSTSDIEWTDATWNPVRGCVKVSAGCKNCYAETFAERFRGVKGHPYEQGFDLRLVPEKLAEPLSWKKPRRVFVNSMSDLFQEGVPFEYIDQVFAVMALAPQHTFQVLTKRADQMLAYLTRTVDGWGRSALIAEAAQALCGFDGHQYDTMKAVKVGSKFVLPSSAVFWMGSCNPPDQPYRERWIMKAWPLSNVWLGVSVENQHFADERIPLMLQTPAAVRFISAEPLLGPVDIAPWLRAENCNHSDKFCEDIGCRGETWLDWVIVGGESGHGARPFDIAWARSVLAQCRAAGVACFVKQLGAKAYGPDTHSAILNDRKGGDMAEWPEDLRVREFPS